MKIALKGCNTETIVRQIGHTTILAISGGKIIPRSTGVTLPAGRGYSVDVDLTGDDLWRVRRVFRRGGVEKVKGEQGAVFREDLSDVVYRASCFDTDTFPAPQPDLQGELFPNFDFSGKPSQQEGVLVK